MQSDARKKQQERCFLDRVLSAAAIKPLSIVPAEPPDPDFILELDGRIVGVEMTSIYIPAIGNEPPLKAQEELTDRIVATAREQYQLRGSPPVDVQVLFHLGIDIRTVNRNKVAHALSALVATIPSDHPGRAHWENDYENTTLDCIARVTALRTTDWTMAHWHVARSGWRADFPSDLLRQSIATKNKKLCRYRQTLKEVWLVIALEGNRPSQFFDIDSPPETSDLSSHFDRTFLYCSVPERLYSLERLPQPGLKPMQG